MDVARPMSWNRMSIPTRKIFLSRQIFVNPNAIWDIPLRITWNCLKKVYITYITFLLEFGFCPLAPKLEDTNENKTWNSYMLWWKNKFFSFRASSGCFGVHINYELSQISIFDLLLEFDISLTCKVTPSHLFTKKLFFFLKSFIQ